MSRRTGSALLASARSRGTPSGMTSDIHRILFSGWHPQRVILIGDIIRIKASAGSEYARRFSVSEFGASSG